MKRIKYTRKDKETMNTIVSGDVEHLPGAFLDAMRNNDLISKIEVTFDKHIDIYERPRPNELTFKDLKLGQRFKFAWSHMNTYTRYQKVGYNEVVAISTSNLLHFTLETDEVNATVVLDEGPIE